MAGRRAGEAVILALEHDHVSGLDPMRELCARRRMPFAEYGRAEALETQTVAVDRANVNRPATVAVVVRGDLTALDYAGRIAHERHDRLGE
jgi:hypothetical protein